MKQDPRLRLAFCSCPCSRVHAPCLYSCRQRRRGTERQAGYGNHKIYVPEYLPNKALRLANAMRHTDGFRF